MSSYDYVQIVEIQLNSLNDIKLQVSSNLLRPFADNMFLYFIKQTEVEDYTNEERLGAKTWVPVVPNALDFSLEEVTLCGSAHLAFEITDSQGLTLEVRNLVGPDVHKSDTFGTLHIGPNQFVRLFQTPTYLPLNLRLYDGGTLVLPDVVTFQSSRSTLDGALGGASTATVIDTQLSLGRGATSLPDVTPNTVNFEVLNVKHGSIVSVSDDDDLFFLEAKEINISPGGQLVGRSLSIVADSIVVEDTGILSVDYGGPHSVSSLSDFIPGVGGSLGGEGGYGVETNMELSLLDYRRTSFSSPTLPGEAGHCRATINNQDSCITGLAPSGGGTLQIRASDIINHGTISAKGASATMPYIHLHSGGGSGGSIFLVATSYMYSTGVIDASGGDGYQDGSTYTGGGGSGGIITVFYADGAVENTPVSCGGFGHQSGGAGITLLRREEMGSLVYNIVVENCNKQTERSAQLFLENPSFSLETLIIREGGNMNIHRSPYTGPSDIDTGTMIGDRSGSVHTFDGVILNIGTCSSPPCVFGMQTEVDLAASVVIDPGSVMRVPSHLTLRGGITLDLCGAIDGIQDGRVDVRNGGSFLASYPAETGLLTTEIGTLRINEFHVYQNGVFRASSRCDPTNEELHLDFAVFETLFGAQFDPSTFNLTMAHPTLEPSGNLLENIECPTSGHLTLLSGQNCSLPTGSFTFESVTVHGGAFISLQGDVNGTMLTEITATSLYVYPGGRIDGNGAGLAHSPSTAVNSGGSHGGYGGLATEPPFGSIISPRAYGAPGYGSPGGGQIMIQILDCMVVDGIISVDGAKATSLGHGGGSGGSILIETPCLRGFGVLSSQGGDVLSGSGGGGSGGCIAIHLSEDKYDFAGSIVVDGGNGSEDGSTGTVFIQDSREQTELILSGHTPRATKLERAALGNLRRINNLHITSGYQLEVSSKLSISTLHGDSTGQVFVTSNALLEVERAHDQHLGTQCSFDVSENSTLLLPNNTAISCSVQLCLNLRGTLLANQLVLANGGSALISGDLQVTSIDLRRAASLHVLDGAIVGHMSETQALNVSSVQIGVQAHLSVGGTLTVYTQELQIREDSMLTSDLPPAADSASFSIYCKAAFISRGAVVSVDSQGYEDGIGSPPDSRSGASHGGQGGAFSGSVGNTYGAGQLPREPGSGVRADNGISTRGGGAVMLQVEGYLVLDGRISANGQDGFPDVGGGSGGSISLMVGGDFSGHGSVSANGGAGSGSSSSGAGGGRIAISSSQSAGFYGVLTAFGGVGKSNGAAGTIYITNSLADTASLTVDNGGAATSSVTVFDSSEDHTSLDMLVMKGNAQLQLETPPSARITVRELDGDRTCAIHIVDDQKLFLAKTQATATTYYLSCAVTIEEHAELALPPVVYIRSSHATDTSLRLSGRLTDVSSLTIGAGASVLIDHTAHTAAYGSGGEYLFVDPQGTLSVSTIQLHGHSELECALSTSTAVRLILVSELHVRYGASIRGGWLQITTPILDVEYGGQISGDGGGYESGQGLCPGVSDPGSGSGACHGGAGGTSSSGASTSPLVIGSLYGTKEFGSGGGDGSSGTGGIGGGLVSIESEHLRLDGTISVDGLSANGTSGGGSAGALHISTQSMSGSGSVRAAGGSGGDVGGGGGGGGRVALFLTSESQFTGSFIVHGGSAAVNNQAGASGTAFVWTSLGITTRRELYIDNDGALSSSPLLTVLNETLEEPHVFSKLSVRNGVILQAVGEDVAMVVDILDSDSSCTIDVHDGMILSIEAQQHSSIFHCSFDVESDGELRLPYSVMFMGPSNQFSGTLTNMFELIVGPSQTLSLSPLARTAVNVGGEYTFISERGVYNLASLVIQEHAVLSFDTSVAADRPARLSVGQLQVDYGGVLRVPSLILEGNEIALHPGGSIDLTGGSGSFSMEGPGAGANGTGGGHGGRGGSRMGETLPGGPGYGDVLRPDVGGSRGGDGTVGHGGDGGGFLSVTLSGSASIDGNG
ncbi:uncharacterized protein [Diadema antillarum]|uniref:uncharacterized protein n=1 Tax=Diadema antillarum TaxID=105358 RepID=UPI003A88D464